MKKELMDFLFYLNDKELINNHDFDYEKEVDKYLNKNKQPRKPLVDIFNEVCNKLNVHPNEVKGKTRAEEFVRARIVYTIIALTHEYRLKQIGKLINRHHASIIHYKSEYENINYNPKLLIDYLKCV